MVMKENEILAKIQNLEKQKEEIIKSRLEEIGEIILKTGGVALDNRIIAGFCVFASDKKNEDSPILKKLLELGKDIKLPTRKIKRKV